MNEIDSDEYKDELVKKLFEWRWPITTRLKWTYNDYDYQVKGINVTGDFESDSWAMEDWVNVTKTIAELAEMHEYAQEFIVRDTSYLKEMFEIIQQYTALVAKEFNESIYLNNVDLTSNETVQEVLRDIIKLQNLGNRIYPVVDARIPIVPETEGLIGYINKQAGRFGNNAFDFDPVERFGFNRYNTDDQSKFNREQGTYNVIDVNDEFNPQIVRQLNTLI